MRIPGVSSAAHALQRTMPFTEDAAVVVHDIYGEGAPVFHPKNQRNIDQSGRAVGLHGALNPKEAGDGKPGTGQALIAGAICWTRTAMGIHPSAIRSKSTRTVSRPLVIL